MHETAITLRRGGLKVPDAIIAATSAAHGITLLTADRDFASVESIQCVLLEV
jgi:predicted nucleic acid-binding protein